MSMQKIKISVTKTFHHTVEMKLTEDEMNSLVDDLDGQMGDDIAGDMCNRFTIDEDECEVTDYSISDL